MAQFIGYVHGQRNEASRLGSKNSGLTAIAKGWNIGGKIDMSHRAGQDTIQFFLNGGSNNRYGSNYFLELSENEVIDILKGEKRIKITIE